MTEENDRVNILLVDDQPGKLLSYEAILGELGENLLRAGSAKEALECLLRNEVAVVLVDVCMPELDGYELASMIRQHPRHQRTAIILVSAVLHSDFDRVKGYSSGAMDYLPVPIVPEILRAKVAVFVDLFRKSTQLELLNRDLERRVTARTVELEASTRRLEASEAALREASRRKDEFLALLAHELRNPLAPIRNAAQLLKLREGQDRETEWNIEVIERQVAHLTRLVDDLLDASRVDRGKLTLRRAPATLQEVLASALESRRPLMDCREQQLRVDLPAEPIRLEADLVRLSQVFANLLDNASKFTPPRGSVTLSARLLPPDSAGPGEVEVRVRDTGIGVAAEELPRVFEMFVQLSDLGHRAESGLGIGLALARHLVELHGGTIAAQSEGVGQGTEFVVRLPTEDAPEAAPARGRAIAPAAAPPRRVLVVDDLADSVESLAILLRRLGHVVASARGGLEALALADSFRPEIVLLDIGLPDLDGFEVCRRIRAEPWGGRMKLIALTGWGEDRDRARAHEVGFDAHLIKPLEPDTLLTVLASPPRAADPAADPGQPGIDSTR